MPWIRVLFVAVFGLFVVNANGAQAPQTQIAPSDEVSDCQIDMDSSDSFNDLFSEPLEKTQFKINANGQTPINSILNISKKSQEQLVNEIKKECDLNGEELYKHINELKETFCKKSEVLLTDLNKDLCFAKGKINISGEIYEDFKENFYVDGRNYLRETLKTYNGNCHFFQLIDSSINLILRNPIGRLLIKQINKKINSMKILFVQKESQSFRDLKVIHGKNKYIIVIIPSFLLTWMSISCDIIAVDKKDQSIQSSYVQPFHSMLAHELIHCLHCCENMNLYDVYASSNVPNLYFNYDNLEELRTVLGINISIPRMGVKEEQLIASFDCNPDLINTCKVFECSISQFLYDLYANDISVCRILYYNKKGVAENKQGKIRDLFLQLSTYYKGGESNVEVF